jgi:hypothetical protein
MSNRPSSSDTVSVSKVQPSTVRKVIQAALLALAWVILGAVPSEAAAITCHFGSGEGAWDYGCSNPNGPNRVRYSFGDYFFDLTLNDLEGSFEVTISDDVIDAEEFSARAAAFPGYAPLALTENGDYIDFVVSFDPAYDPQDLPWSSYDFTIDWNFGPYFPPEGSRVTVLHSIGRIDGNAYDEDMCLVYNNCVYDPYPSIRSGNTDFGTFTVAVAPVSVPEPASALMLGIGLGSLAFFNRRRRTSR